MKIDLQLGNARQVINDLNAVSKALAGVQSGVVKARGSSATLVKRGPIGKPPPTFMDKLERVIMSSRIGIGPSGVTNIMPLMGQLSKLIPGLGELTIAIGAAKATFDAIDTVGNTAIDQEGRRLGYGGTDRQRAGLEEMGQGVGLDSGQMMSIAQRLLAARQAGGMAAVDFGPALPTGIGPPANLARDMIQAIMRIRAMPEKQAISEARTAGIPDILRFRGISDTMLNNLARMGSATSDLQAPNAADARNAGVITNTGKKELSDKIQTIGEEALGFLSGLLGMPSPNVPGSPLAQPGEQGTGGPTPRGSLPPITESALPSAADWQAHREALNQNTIAIRSMSLGVTGGGQFARGGVPSGLAGMLMMGEQFDRQAEGQIRLLGAFST